MLKENPDAIKKTVTIDDTWVSLYMSPDRNQRRQWVFPGEEPEPTTRENIHGNKRILIMALDYNGIAFWELLPVTKKKEYFVKWLGYPNKFNSWVENVE